MTEALIECVPNFSEGRRVEVIDAITDAIQAVEGVRVLDRHIDADHHRSVITFVGPPEPILQAAFAAMATAAELIDLNQHQGEHPRIGATDVLPFVPMAGATLADCVGLAQRLGERVGRELGLPVYLYEAAATRESRRNLADVRRGQYENLREWVLTDPAYTPDFGPSVLGPAGATAIGARRPLIAYNVYLTTDDVTIARKIAETVRFSGGGLACVKALGLMVDGRAQVSMNFTDFQRTGLAQTVEMIRREAARYGTAIHHTELVGLIPQQALIDAARWYLQLDDFHEDQILENRLYDVRLIE
jgi:glutamate formiminotransferase